MMASGGFRVPSVVVGLRGVRWETSHMGIEHGDGPDLGAQALNSLPTSLWLPQQLHLLQMLAHPRAHMQS